MMEILDDMYRLDPSYETAVAEYFARNRAGGALAAELGV